MLGEDKGHSKSTRILPHDEDITLECSTFHVGEGWALLLCSQFLLIMLKIALINLGF